MRNKMSAFDLIRSSLSCQFLRLKSVGKLCKKGLFAHGCRKCFEESLDFLYAESDEVAMKNCEKYAQEIYDAVRNGVNGGLNPGCAMYKYRTDGEKAFEGTFAKLAESIICDTECEQCHLDSVKWLVSDAE